AVLSMWISNTATALMMMPIAGSLISVMHLERCEMPAAERANFSTAMMLGIAYAASIGGLGTLIGSPPNALLASFMSQTYGVDITFAAWMAIALPVSLVMLPLAWLVLTAIAYPFADRSHDAGRAAIEEALSALGPMRRQEKRVAVVFALVAAAWVFTPLAESLLRRTLISDTGIAIAGAVLLFALPADWKNRTFLLNWSWARRAPWEVLLLFGGGLSLAQAIDQTGLAAWIGSGLGALSGLPVLLLAGGVALLVIFLTELTSNTATTAAFLPVVGAVALGAGYDPLLLAVPAAIAASCAFMLPVATPPNAIVYATGYVTVAQMIRAGLILNILGIMVIAGLTALALPVLFAP
ncbi:MAG TPA: DASS family sodium-coupled anion symporter, partial [Hyphomicrobiales bacterium]|nr:DASS family sodium-coupled anion symporter [Hyphomicrobiales bacterium]